MQSNKKKGAKMKKVAMMKCGCTANSVNTIKKCQSCVIHNCDEIEENTPDLTGRMAHCSCCEKKEESNFELPFFRYRGVGSKEYFNKCRNCGFLKIAHVSKKENSLSCDNFQIKEDGWEDEYYCGCKGWD